MSNLRTRSGREALKQQMKKGAVSEEIQGPGLDAYRNILLKRSESMLSAAESINKAVDDDLRRVPESYFYMRVFPIIRDWLEGKGNKEMGVWLNIADGTSREIVVVDDDTQEELFRCPPATVQRIAPVINRGDGNRVTTLDDILNRQELLMKAGNVRAAMEIEGQLPEIYDFNEKTSRDYLDYIHRFILMYERYEEDPELFLGSDYKEIKKALSGLYPELKEKGSTTATQPVEAADAPVDIDDFDF